MEKLLSRKTAGNSKGFVGLEKPTMKPRLNPSTVAQDMLPHAGASVPLMNTIKISA